MLINYWPVQFTTITNRFGASPAYYKQFKLPGHEGLDFRVQYHSFVSPIYACTEGAISFIGYRNATDPYGYQVRIKTEYAGRAYEFVYAHLTNGSSERKVGEMVRPGMVLGKGGATGNARGAHLHVSIKRNEATRDKETTYPYDLIDPEPFFTEYIRALGLEVEWK